MHTFVVQAVRHLSLTGKLWHSGPLVISHPIARRCKYKSKPLILARLDSHELQPKSVLWHMLLYLKY